MTRKKKILLLILIVAVIAGIGLIARACSLRVAKTTPASQQSFVEQQATERKEPEGQQEPVPQQETVSEQEAEPEINIRMVGDILLHDPVEESAKQEDGSYDFSSIFQHTRDDIAQADLALVNQEVIIGGAKLGVSGYPAFNAPFELADDLADTGFDVICHATNHALDKGKKGILNCLDNWESKYPGIAVVGINASKEDRQHIYVYEKDGIRIAILNYTYGTNGISLPSGMPYAVNLLEEKAVVEDIKKAHDLADFVVVCPHWGTEYSLEVSEDQTRWTRIFLENGVNLVIGTHPHVIEKYEMIRDGDREMLVYYSLGNFVNWTSGKGEGVANRMVGGMADLTVGYDDNHKLVIKEYGIIPLVCHVTSPKGGVTVYKLEDYSPELASQNEIVRQDSSFSYEYVNKLCQKIWDIK